MKSGAHGLFAAVENVNDCTLTAIIGSTKKEAIKTKYNEYLKGLGKSPNTVKAYQGDIEAFISATKKPLPSLTDTDISNYIGGLMEHCGASTRARKISALKSYFAFKVAVGEIKTNPAVDLKAPKREKRIPVNLNLSESLALLDNVQGKYAIRDKAILTLFLNCGMRLSELVGIDRDHIRDDTLRVIGKGNKERTIYLNKSCLDALNLYLDTRSDNDKTLFLSERGSRISNRTVQELVKRHIIDAGLDPKR